MEIAKGSVVECPPGTWKFSGSRYTLFLRVDSVRDDLSGFYDDQVWLEGWQLARDGTPLGWMQALVKVDDVKIVHVPQEQADA